MSDAAISHASEPLSATGDSDKLHEDAIGVAVPRWAWGALYAFAAAVAFAALARFSLFEPTQWWATTTFTIMAAVFVIVALVGVLHDGRARSFAVGFSVLGWFYLLFVYGPWFETHFAPRLMTTRALVLLQAELEQNVPPLTNSGPPPIGYRWVENYYTWSGNPISLREPVLLNAMALDIGQSLWAIVVGVLGGLIGMGLRPRRGIQS